MSRSLWKEPILNFNLIKQIVSAKKKIKVWSRSSIIPSILINKQVLIHTGNSFKPLFVTREKVGFKFGEFAFTRSKNKKKKKIKKNGSKK
jgi:ribosomal protein S19